MQRLVCLFLLLTTGIYAQEFAFNQVETQSLVLYEKSDWNGLIVLEQSVKNQNIDYHYYNVRLGVAYFNLKNYYGAEKYFVRAIKNNSTDFVLEYLYWTYINLGQVNRAKEIHGQLSDEVRKKILNENKWIESIYPETGLKKSNNNLVGDLFYASLTANHRINNRLTATQGIGFIKQDGKIDDSEQKQYNLFPSYYLKNGYAAHLGFMFTTNNHKRINLEGVESAFYNQNQFKGTVLHASVSKNYQRWIAELYGYYLSLSVDGKFINDQGLFTLQFSNQQSIVGLNSSYHLPFWNNRLVIGTRFFQVMSEDHSYFSVSPYCTVFITPKITSKIVYYTIDKSFFADKEAGIFFNNPTIKTTRIANTVTYHWNADWQVIGTYSHEKITNNDIPYFTHALNAYFLGINYTF